MNSPERSGWRSTTSPVRGPPPVGPQHQPVLFLAAAVERSGLWGMCSVFGDVYEGEAWVPQKDDGRGVWKEWGKKDVGKRKLGAGVCCCTAVRLKSPPGGGENFAFVAPPVKCSCGVVESWCKGSVSVCIFTSNSPCCLKCVIYTGCVDLASALLLLLHVIGMQGAAGPLAPCRVAGLPHFFPVTHCT